MIRGNHIHNAPKGIWLDWMTQGTRVSGNLIYDSYSEDLFVEVNHGPFMIDNNLLLSPAVAILDGSSGGAYVHNLVVGKIIIVQQNRATPFHLPHSTAVLGRVVTRNGDNRYLNNIFCAVDEETNRRMPNPWWIGRGSYGLGTYTGYHPMYVDGNIYYHGAEEYPDELNVVFRPEHDPEIRIEERDGGVYLHMKLDGSMKSLRNKIVTTEILGRVKTSDARYEQADGTPLLIDTDYRGQSRNPDDPSPGPIEDPGEGEIVIQVW